MDAVRLRSKSILLVDSNRQSRESRTKMIQMRGIPVDCVVDVGAARVRLAADKYDLILVDPGRERGMAESLVQEIRANNPRQLVGFLVGSPLFITKSLTGGGPHSPRQQPHTPATTMTAAAATPNPCADDGIDFQPRVRDAEARSK